MLIEKADSNGKIVTVVCSNCGFESSQLEYHAWKHIQEGKPPKRKTVPDSQRQLDSQEPFDPEIPLDAIKGLWESIRLPTLIILLTLMIITIIIITRALIPMPPN